MKTLLLVVAVVFGMLALTNPNEEAFRGFIQTREGLGGTLGLGLIDLFSKDSRKGVHRDNYLVFSRFYLGGDGVLPRQELGWGIAGKCFYSGRKEEK